ncbi:MAG: hypothetical protein K2L96_02645 [Muribaculaceae bacterium]|nr:hypothetical protein [Muribaculaceae bacterium]
MGKVHEYLQAGLGCLAIPIMLCGFAIFLAALPLCIVVGIAELIVYGLIGLLLRLTNVDIFTGTAGNISLFILAILMIFIVGYIFSQYPNLFFNLLLFGDDYFPRLKP